MKCVFPSPIEEVNLPLLQEKGLRLLVKREDLIHPLFGGNKWRKLKYNLEEARREGKPTLLTFGGAYSNHIYATAAAGAWYGFQTVGIIRGEEVLPLNPTLQFARGQGMQLEFISRREYRRKEEKSFLLRLEAQYGGSYIIPEGGTNALALPGCAEIVDEVTAQLPELPDFWCLPAGTGGTISGVANGLDGKATALGFSVLKGIDLRPKVKALLHASCHEDKRLKVAFQYDYHFGGFARFTQELLDFIRAFRRQTDIRLDPIYTGKLFFGIFDLIKKNYFPEGSVILAIHTGGLQGIAGFEERFGIKL